MVLKHFPVHLPNAMATATMSASSPKKTKVMTPLKGVVFDMENTLVRYRSNIDTSSVYREAFGRDPDPSKCKVYDYDILLKEVESIENAEEKARAYKIINETEEKHRRTRKMMLMPGSIELLTFLSLQKIPTALVTRNCNRDETKALCQQLTIEREEAQRRGQQNAPDLSFKRIIAQDDSSLSSEAGNSSEIMNALASKDCFDCEISEILVVGTAKHPSATNLAESTLDLGKSSGTKTALLASVEEATANATTITVDTDLHIQRLTELPRQLWNHFFIYGPNGNSPENDYGKFHKSPIPEPQSELCQAIVQGDLARVRALLGNLSLNEITTPDENGNTALIWAAETGNVGLARLLLDDIVEKSIPTHDTLRRLQSFQNHHGYLGATALNRAARRNHTEFLEFLIREGDRLDMNLPNYKMQYPLHFCAFKKNPEACEYLLMCGANPWVLDRKGRTPLEDSTCETCNGLLRAAMSSSS